MCPISSTLVVTTQQASSFFPDQSLQQMSEVYNKVQSREDSDESFSQLTVHQFQNTMTSVPNDYSNEKLLPVVSISISSAVDQPSIFILRPFPAHRLYLHSVLLI